MMTDPTNDMLEDLFAQARAVAPHPSDALVARVLADAGNAALSEPTPKAAPQLGFLARFMDMIGGWPAIGSLAAATVAGVWVGVAPPVSVEDFTASTFGDPVTIGIFADDLDFEIGLLTDG